MNDDLRSLLVRRLRVGARVSVGRNVATVRYVGPIQGRNDEWVGFEWDDPDRGKHDGSHDGVRYFTCVYHPHAGSFVRLTKLLEAVDSITLGCSLENAIYAKYKVPTLTSHNATLTSHGDQDPSGPAPVLVGEQEALDKAAVDGSLSQASFVGMGISSLIPTLPVLSFLRNVSVLDLSTNLISSWESVLELFGESDGVCRMSTLILSDNRFTIADSEPNPQNQLRQLPSINTLVLNSCGRLNMDDVLIIGKYLPNLRALHLCNNHISRLSNQSPLGKKQSMLSVFAKLETLDLENNELSDWRDVLDACGDLPALKTLLLSGNCIQSVSKDNGAVDARQHFTSLRCLALGSNNISSWKSVDALNTFTSLEELRLSDNPLELAKQSAEGIRYHIIARVPSLKVLNGGSISLAERHDAELAFLGWTRQGSPGINHHPRVMELRAKYGLEDLGGGDGSVDHAAGVQTQGRTLASSMVTLTFVSSTSGQLEKRVPTTLTIGRLRLLCERLLRVKLARDQPIVLSPPGQSDTERIFEEIAHHLNDRELAYFGVDTDGWSVYVDHVDHQLDGFKPSSGQQAVQKDLQRRLEAQESGWRRLREEERRLLLSSGNPATVNVAANSSARQLRDLT